MSNTLTELLKKLWDDTKRLFSLHLDTDEAGTIENVKKSIEFKGGNLWALIFACLIASIGLNNNSTAVVIGAMLISPLMGPIVGVGYSVATNDFETLKRSLRNLLLMLVLSIGAAAIYFLLSPLKDATPELTSRIRPSLYDVLIAIFGGVVGIVASSRRDRGNAIPGVAIATALMPPLCTAGYGLATLQLNYFIGAFYLFFINSLFIALTTMLVVRSLQFPQKEFLDKKREKRVKILIWVVVILTIIPSIFTAWMVVNEAVFKRTAQEFVEQMKFPSSEVLSYNARYNRDTSEIEVIIFGDKLSDEIIANLEYRMKEAGLTRTKLDIHQDREKRKDDNQNSFDYAKYDEIYRNKITEIEARDEQIRKLQKQLSDIEENKPALYRSKLDLVSKKVAALYPEVEAMGFSEVIKTSIRNDSTFTDTIPTAIVKWQTGQISAEFRKRLDKYLKMEIGIDTIQVVDY